MLSKKFTLASSSIPYTSKKTLGRTVKQVSYVPLSFLVFVSNGGQQFGNVNDQIEIAAKQIANIKELQAGFDAIGFSQGQPIMTRVRKCHKLFIQAVSFFALTWSNTATVLPQCTTS
jgi:hypothetical protein